MSGLSINSTRRKFLLGVGALSISGLIGYRELKNRVFPSDYSGKISGANFDRGHLLRDPKFPNPTSIRKVKNLIVGAGVSGLSCAYELKRQSEEFLLIELDSKIGGNSLNGNNKQGAFPLGAHYLPTPGNDALELKKLLQDLDIIVNKDLEKPEYDELFLCHEMEERLFIHGVWQEGLIPEKGLSDADKKEINRFLIEMEMYNKKVGADGRKAFTIPLERSSKDIELIDLDKISMKKYLVDNNFNNEYLIWYVDYCCRDDYGAGIDKVSAWAGIHYFAARETEELLTWPEGNGYLVKQITEKVKDNIETNKILYSVNREGNKNLASVYDFELKKSIQYECENLIYCGPSFSAKNIFKINRIKDTLDSFDKEYVPWMSANIEVEGYENWGNLNIAWDNVNYHGRSLGYVNSNHQAIQTKRSGLNLTQYWDLDKLFGKKARVSALTKTHKQWCDLVIKELQLTHRDIIPYIKSIDIALFGHAMAIPKPNFLSIAKLHFDQEKVYFAHTDVNYLSLFEQAFYQGYYAAQKVIANG